jgi:hypothetical protein
MAQHAQWRRAGASNNASLVVHCDGPLDPARVRQAFDRFVTTCPWPAARLQRTFPWGKLRWVVGAGRATTASPVRHAIARTSTDLHRLVEAELSAVIDPRREAPARLTVIDVQDAEAQGGVLVLTWFHPLMDPRGAQNLLAHLATLDVANGRAPRDESAPAFVASPVRQALRERGRLARRSLAYMRTLAPVPPVSPGTRLTTPGPPRFLRGSFVERDSEARAARGTREISWRLAVVGKAMAELWRRRGLPDVPFLLPIAVDLRRKGEAGPIFGNLLAFHFARFRPSETEDVPALASMLRRQMADAVRDGQIDANAAAMEFLHYRPLSTMLRALPWTAHGDLFSFNCADVSEVPPALERVFGRRVLNAYHVPCVLPQPGVGVFFNRCGGVQNVVVSWVEGAVSGPEAARILELVAEGMEWIAKP